VRGLSEASAPESPDEPEIPKGFSSCPNCGKAVPTGNLPLHQVHCERNTYRCQTCHRTMPAGEREAHENAFKDCNRLFSAVSEGNLAVVQDHFQHGALASSTNSNGDTVLHVAVLSLHQHRSYICILTLVNIDINYCLSASSIIIVGTTLQVRRSQTQTVAWYQSSAVVEGLDITAHVKPYRSSGVFNH